MAGHSRQVRNAAICCWSAVDIIGARQSSLLEEEVGPLAKMGHDLLAEYPHVMDLAVDIASTGPDP